MQKLQYAAQTAEGATVTVNAYLTFEGNPVMKLADFKNWQMTSYTRLLLVRMEINYIEEAEILRRGKISNGKISAYREQWMTLPDYFKLLAEFEQHGTDYIHTFVLKAKWNDSAPL